MYASTVSRTSLALLLIGATGACATRSNPAPPPDPGASCGPTASANAPPVLPLTVAKSDGHKPVPGMSRRVRPRNVDDVVAAMNREYPADLRSEGIGGTTVVWVFVDGRGEVEASSIAQTSGEEALDAAALRVAEVLAFDVASPSECVPFWTSLPFTFTPTQANGSGPNGFGDTPR